MSFSNARILYNYDVWDAVDAANLITSSSHTSGHEDDYLLKDRLAQEWHSANGAVDDQWVKLDLQTPTRLTCFAAVGGNWTANAALTLQANTTDSWTDPPYSQGLTIALNADGVPWRHIVLFLDQTYRWWRLLWDDPTQPDPSGDAGPQLKLGRLLAGQYYQFVRNFARGARFSWSDPSDIEHKPGTLGNDASASSLALPFRQIRADFPKRDSTEWDRWQAIYQKVGKRRPVILALDPEGAPTAQSIYGYIITDLEAAWERYSRLDVATLVFEEKTF